MKYFLSISISHFFFPFHLQMPTFGDAPPMFQPITPLPTKRLQQQPLWYHLLVITMFKIPLLFSHVLGFRESRDEEIWCALRVVCKGMYFAMEKNPLTTVTKEWLLRICHQKTLDLRDCFDIHETNLVSGGPETNLTIREWKKRNRELVKFWKNCKYFHKK